MSPRRTRRNNIYNVTVQATGGELKVAVTVTNVEEAGSIRLTQLQPQVGISVEAKLSDPDQNPTVRQWQWARSSDQTNGKT